MKQMRWYGSKTRVLLAVLALIGAPTVRAQSSPGESATGATPAAVTVNANAYLGVYIEGPADGGGVKLAGVVAGSPAEKAGLQQGDSIISIGDRTVASEDELRDAIAANGVGTKVKISFLRNGEKRRTSAKLAAAPTEETEDEAGEDEGDEASESTESNQVGFEIKPGIEFTTPTVDDNAGYMGVQLTAGDDGVSIGSVMDNSPAAAAGLEAGDTIVKFDGQDVSDANALVELVRAHKPGETVKVTVMRGEEKKKLKVTLGKRDLAAMQAIPGMPMIGTLPGGTLAVPVEVAPMPGGQVRRGTAIGTGTAGPMAPRGAMNNMNKQLDEARAQIEQLRAQVEELKRRCEQQQQTLETIRGALGRSPESTSMAMPGGSGEMAGTISFAGGDGAVTRFFTPTMTIDASSAGGLMTLTPTVTATGSSTGEGACAGEGSCTETTTYTADGDGALTLGSGGEMNLGDVKIEGGQLILEINGQQQTIDLGDAQQHGGAFTFTMGEDDDSDCCETDAKDDDKCDDCQSGDDDENDDGEHEIRIVTLNGDPMLHDGAPHDRPLRARFVEGKGGDERRIEVRESVKARHTPLQLKGLPAKKSVSVWVETDGDDDEGGESGQCDSDNCCGACHPQEVAHHARGGKKGGMAHASVAAHPAIRALHHPVVSRRLRLLGAEHGDMAGARKHSAPRAEPCEECQECPLMRAHAGRPGKFELRRMDVRKHGPKGAPECVECEECEDGEDAAGEWQTGDGNFEFVFDSAGGNAFTIHGVNVGNDDDGDEDEDECDECSGGKCDDCDEDDDGDEDDEIN